MSGLRKNSRFIRIVPAFQSYDSSESYTDTGSEKIIYHIILD